jgi:transposase
MLSAWKASEIRPVYLPWAAPFESCDGVGASDLLLDHLGRPSTPLAMRVSSVARVSARIGICYGRELRRARDDLPRRAATIGSVCAPGSRWIVIRSRPSSTRMIALAGDPDWSVVSCAIASMTSRSISGAETRWTGSPGRSAAELLRSGREGACLFTKKLERGRFLWPTTADGAVTISTAQLGYLLSGIDWHRPQATWRPTLGRPTIRLAAADGGDSIAG